MAEPIRLNKDGEAMTVHAPRWAAQLVRDEGWRIGEPDRAPRVVQEASKEAQEKASTPKRTSSTSKSKEA